jgi:hypothetical protein
MRTLPTREALVAAYWRKLASSIEAAYTGRGRVFATGAAGALQARRRRVPVKPIEKLKPASTVAQSASNR